MRANTSAPLLRESVLPKKRHPAENYYELNFPVIKAADRAAFETVCRTMAQQIAQFFEKKQGEMERLARTATFVEQGCGFSDVLISFYTSAHPEARKLLEERGVLPFRSPHANGAEWVFSAEEQLNVHHNFLATLRLRNTRRECVHPVEGRVAPTAVAGNTGFRFVPRVLIGQRENHEPPAGLVWARPSSNAVDVQLPERSR